MITLLRLAVVIALSLVAVAGCQKPPARASASQAAPDATKTPAPQVKPLPAQLPEIVARVDGDAIGREEFERAIKNVEASGGEPVPAERRAEIYRQVLDQLIAFKLLAHESAARRLTIPDAEVDGRLKEVRGRFPSEEAFVKALAAQGMTPDSLRQEARMSLLVTRLMESEIGKDAEIQANEVSDFYQQNRPRFEEPESVRASHILLRVPEKADAATRTKAREQADAVLKQARGGADFAALAREFSQDPGSAARGGDLGFFRRGQMVPAFETAAFALQPGEMTGVVETTFGYHIIKAAERRPARTLSLEEVRQDVTRFLAERKRQEQAQAFIARLKTKGKVEIYI